jgi:hypothetical protein
MDKDFMLTLAAKLMVVAGGMLEALKDVHDVCEYKTLLGFVTDMWAAKNRIPDEEALRIFEDVAEAQKEVWATEGTPSEEVVQ